MYIKSKKLNKIKGNYGENIAIQYLKKKYYKILDKNYKTRFGEIDIVAERDNVIIFIEVKLRKSIKYGYPVESVNRIKLKRIKNVAKYFIMVNRLETKQIRFDIIEVYLVSQEIFLNHIKCDIS